MSELIKKFPNSGRAEGAFFVDSRGSGCPHHAIVGARMLRSENPCRAAVSWENVKARGGNQRYTPTVASSKTWILLSPSE